MALTRSLVALAALAGLALTGCTGPDSVGPAEEATSGSLSEADSPLREYRNLAFGAGRSLDGSPQERWRAYAEQQNRLNELIAACMAEQGFDYPVKRINEESVPTDLDGPAWEPESRDWVARYGYGLANYPGRTELNAQPDDPEEEESSMTEAEEAAYQEAMFGREPEEGEPYDWRKAGCRGAAEHEVLGYQAWQDAENQPIIDAINAFYQAVDTNAAFAPLDAEWAACMTEQDHPEFAAQREAPASIQALLDAYHPAEEDADEPDSRTKDPRFATLDDPAYAEIAAKEVELALVDLGCREQTDYRQRHLQTRFTLEEQFIADHAEELEALRSRAEQAGR